MKRHLHYAASALLLAGILGAAACGGDDDSDDASSETTAASDDSDDSGRHSRDEYVAVLADAAEGLTDEQAECVSGAIVDTVGVDQLEAAGSYDKIQDNPEGNLSDFGITFDEAQGTAFFQATNDCMDVRGMLTEEMTSGDNALPPEVATCIVDALDDATLSQLFVAGMTGTDAPDAATSTLTDAATTCTTAGTG